VHGTVVDSLGGQPIVNAVVDISIDNVWSIIAHTTTDENGAFSLTLDEREANAQLILSVR